MHDTVSAVQEHTLGERVSNLIDPFLNGNKETPFEYCNPLIADQRFEINQGGLLDSRALLELTNDCTLKVGA